jgi:hypothetical protein
MKTFDVYVYVENEDEDQTFSNFPSLGNRSGFFVNESNHELLGDICSEFGNVELYAYISTRFSENVNWMNIVCGLSIVQEAEIDQSGERRFTCSFHFAINFNGPRSFQIA